MTVDTGFDAVLAGEVWVHPDDVKPELTNQPEVKPPVTAAVSAEALVEATKILVQLPANIDWPTLAKLAREIAMDVKERHTVLKDFNLTQAQYDFLETNNEFFKAALQAACIEWHAPMSTAERIKVEAGAILEDSLPGLGARMQSRSEGLPGVIEAAKLFAKVAGVGERESSAGASGERFTINIDLGGDQKITVSTAEAQPASAQPHQLRPLSSGTEGGGDPFALRQITQGEGEGS